MEYKANLNLWLDAPIEEEIKKEIKDMDPSPKRRLFL